MAGRNNRRSAPTLPLAALAGAAVWMYSSMSSSFTASFSASRKSGRIQMKGFNEEFAAWRKTLSKKEKEDCLYAAQNEFNKTYRGSDEFARTDLIGDDKMQDLSKIIGKFIDTEIVEYNKADRRKRVPPKGPRSACAKDKVFDLTYRCVELDRDADRRYKYVSARTDQLAEEGNGERFFESSPMQAYYRIQNNDTDSNAALSKLMEELKPIVKEGLASGGAGVSPAAKKAFDDFLAAKAPGVGDDVLVDFPFMVERMHVWTENMIATHLEDADWMKANGDKLKSDYKVSGDLSSDAGKKELYTNIKRELFPWILQEWRKATDEVESFVTNQKKFYDSAKHVEGKTKADVLKEIYNTFKDSAKEPMAPLDPDILSELEKMPASIPGDGDFRNPWGFASMLYRSEAIDAWGTKYLLGVFETKDEAQSAFNEWNEEFKKAQVSRDQDLAEWSKQEQSRIDKDKQAQKRIAEILELAKDARENPKIDIDVSTIKSYQERRDAR